MTSLLDILGNNAEGAEGASSAACKSCSGAPLEPDPHEGEYAFGFMAKWEEQRSIHPEEPIDGYVLFGSHTDALALFEAAKSEGFDARISPTPRMARSSCGIALLIRCEDAVPLFELASRQGIVIENLVPLPRQIDPKRDRYC